MLDKIKRPPSPPQEDNMVKVRELLFGTEIKKHKTDLENLKFGFESKLNELKKHVDNQIDSIKHLLAQQNSSLTAMIQKIESSSDEKFIVANKKISEANERNLNTLESITKTQNNGLAQLEKTFFSEFEKMAKDNQRDISILRESKMNRSMLVKLLAEAVDKLQVKT